MSLLGKTFFALAMATASLAALVVAAYWWANTVPSRPTGVSANAVFLWAPYVGLPGARRGWWLGCWEEGAHNRCKLNSIDGRVEYEGDFVPYGHEGLISRSQLTIDAAKTREHKLWVGNALVPLVYLKNGEILIPASKYEEGVHLLQQQQPPQPQ